MVKSRLLPLLSFLSLSLKTANTSTSLPARVCSVSTRTPFQTQSQVLLICPVTTDYRTMSTNASSPLAPVIAVTHGGGPLPVLGDPSQAEVARSLRTKVPPLLSKSKAIILVTAHWEEDVTTVSSAAKHNLLYDYHGFPREAYELRYDAPGSPEVARMVLEALKKAGIEGMEDKERGKRDSLFLFWAVRVYSKYLGQ